jgi:EmrB/QacA subfamily drug resistance transporter
MVNNGDGSEWMHGGRVRTATVDADRAYERRWWTLGVLCLSLTVIGIDNTILNVAIPSIVKDVGARGSDLQWIIDAYTIVFAGLLLTAGSLGDRFGRKRMLTTGLVLFGTFSALASRATDANHLIVARGLMGIGGALIFPSTLSILTNTFTGKERGRAIGVWAGVAGLGIAAGPVAGGLLLEHFWWGSVFLVNVPVTIAAVVLGRFFIFESKDPDEGRLDPIGSALSIVTLASLLWAIIQVPDRGWADPTILTGFVVGVVFLGLFAAWELHTEHPMIDVAFFRNPRFSAASAVITLNYFALFGSTFLLTQYFQFALGYSPLKAGFLTAPVAVGLMVGGPSAPRLVERWGTKRVVMGGLCIVIGALLCYGSETLMSSFLWGAIVRAVFGLGMSLTTAPATESIMGSLPPGRAGVGSAINDTTRQTGGALGVAVLGSIFAARYRSLIDLPAALPAQARDLARDSIGKAFGAASTLPDGLGRQVHQAAVDAFVGSMRTAVIVGAVFVATAIAVAWRFLPAYETPHEPDEHLDAAARELASVDDGVYA